MALAKFYYPGISDNKDLTNVFDFDDFVNYTQLNAVMGSNIAIQQFLSYLLDIYNTKSVQNTRDFIENQFQTALYDYIIRNVIAPAVASTNGSTFSATNASQVQYLSDQIYAIIESPTIDWSDLSTIQSQLLAMPSASFNFGSQLTGYANTFDVNAFQSTFVALLMSSLYVAFYFRHITDRIYNCDDFKCKRAFVLAAHVFVYYTFMSVFLVIFGSANSIDSFKNDTGLDNEQLEAFKYQIVLVMDGVLNLLQDENVLDAPDMEIQGVGLANVSTIQGYYDYLKGLSDGNVLKSNSLSFAKQTAQIMQNNLGNYTNEEILKHNQYRRARRSFIVTVVVCVFVLLYLIFLVASRSFLMLYMSSAIIMLVLVIDIIYLSFQKSS